MDIFDNGLLCIRWLSTGRVWSSQQGFQHVGWYWWRDRYEGQARTAGGFQAARPLELHFGLGATERIERLAVRWPSGREQVLTDLAPVPRIEVEEPR